MKKIYLGLILIILICAAGLGWYQSRLSAVSGNSETVTFSIPAGEGAASIVERLEEEGLIKSAFVSKVHLYFNKQFALQAGEYEIEAQTSTKDIIAQFAAGKAAGREVSILLREGLTVREMNEEIKKQGYLLDDSFLAAAAPYEGYLFPDTYRLYKDFTAEDLIAKMRANFEVKLTPELREAMDASGRRPEHIIIMASLLEKEVRTEEEMKIASGLFWDRLEVGQALQSCATLAYILGVNKPQYSYEDTQIPSPYNTYLHPGLPPGPVSNPGLRAIQAAIYPTETDYVYFLSRPDTGETIFSVTLEEHNAAKAKYLK